MIQYISTHGIGNAWVANEVSRVQQAGIEVSVAALYRDQLCFFDSEWARRIDASTNVLYPLALTTLLTSIVTAPFRFRSRFWAALWNAITGPRESTMIRLKGVGHLGVACAWALKLRRQGVSRIHSQWVHSSGTVGMYAAKLIGVPFSFTGHAADLYRDRCALSDKIRAADRIVCISEYHRRFFLEHGARPNQLMVVYCGINVDHFAPEAPRVPDGRLEIRSAGRLVEKKGFAYLISACARLRDRGIPFRCIIGGSGPLEGELRRQVIEQNLEGSVELTGKTIKQERIPEFMRGGDVFCLPCVWASDGDVDGLPQMLMEAMACGLPVVSTRLVGIPDLVVDGETGILVEPGDVEGLTGVLQGLAGDVILRRRLARSGRTLIESRFNLDTCLEPLISLFRDTEAQYEGRRELSTSEIAT